jgi:hypothetical protein
MTTNGLATTMAVLTMAAALAPSQAGAQSGAKALFYGSSGATVQSNAPQSGPTMSRTPDVPGSNLATGFPSSPPMPGMATPAPPTSPAMMPPPAPGMLPPSPPTSGGQAGAGSTDDPTKIIDELKNAVDALPPGLPGGAVAASGASKDLTVVAPAMGVRYWVDLVDAQGNRRQVTTDNVFRRGDRIQLHIMTNQDGYLTLVNIGTSGRTTVLFPSASAPGSNFVKAGADHAVPPGSFLRFEGNPGQEVLVLTFSPRPDAVPSSAAVAMAQGAKDLVHEVDRSSPQPASYAVAPARQGGAGETVAVQIRLKYQ